MARMDIDFPTDLLEGLNELFDDVAPKMIDASLPACKKAVTSSVKQSISTAPEDVKRQTGGLEKSVGLKKAKKTKTNAYIGNIAFNGYDDKKSPNVVKAMALEYGNSRQIPHPFLQRASNNCRKEVLDKMQEVFGQEVNRR